jgi:hypothetical protein
MSLGCCHVLAPHAAFPIPTVSNFLKCPAAVRPGPRRVSEILVDDDKEAPCLRRNETPLLSPKFALALQFANEIHGTQQRKGAGGALHQPLDGRQRLGPGVHGGNETEAIAALLHDAAEDCGGLPMLETVRVMFGDAVAEIVEACTDTMEEPKPAWSPRKEAYVAHLASASPSVKLVAGCDKLHNLQTTLRDLSRAAGRLLVTLHRRRRVAGLVLRGVRQGVGGFAGCCRLRSGLSADFVAILKCAG